MSENNQAAAPKVPKFAGMEIPPELSKTNFFFMFFCTFIAGMFLSLPSVIQPAFMKDIINIDQAFSGSINSFLQIQSQIATLFLVAIIGALSDRTGRKILAILGFLLVAAAFYLFANSINIAAALGIGNDTAATICAFLSFAPSRAAEFQQFAPGLLMSYIVRFILGIGFILVYPQFITMVADYTFDKDRGKGMAANGMCMGLASILVFAIFGAIVSKAGVVAAIYVSACLGIFGAILMSIFVKDRMPEKAAGKKGLKDIIPLVKESKALKAAYVCALVTRADVIVLATYLIAWGVKYGAAQGMETGKATMMAILPMMAMGVVSFMAFPIIGVMIDKKGRMPTIIVSLVFASLGMLLLGVAPSPFSPLCFVAAAFAGIGMAGSIAGANTLAIDAAPITMMGSIMGGLNTMQPIGVLFFLGLGGYLFDTVSPGAAFILKGVATAALLIWMFTIKDAVTKEIQPTFSMNWEDDAKRQMMKVPGGVRQGAIEGTESYAQSEGIETITLDLCVKLKEMMEE
jgi:MFS family permease